MDGVGDLLQPRTDAGVWVQLALLLILLVAAAVGLRDRPDVRLLAVGLLIVLLGLAGLRAAH